MKKLLFTILVPVILSGCACYPYCVASLFNTEEEQEYLMQSYRERQQSGEVELSRARAYQLWLNSQMQKQQQQQQRYGPTNCITNVYGGQANTTCVPSSW